MHSSAIASGIIKKTTLALVLIFVYLLGIHLRLSIYGTGGNAVVPLYLCLLSGAVLSVMFRREVFRSLKHLLLFGAFLLFVPFLNLLLVPGALTVQSYKSSALFLASILLSLALIVALRRIPGYRLRRMIFFIWLLIVLLGVLEILFLHSVFEGISESIYTSSGRGIYTSLDRDVSLYGQIRAKVLASEPSFLAFTLLSLCSIYYVSAHSENIPGTNLRMGFMLFATYAICPSMTIVFFLIALSAWRFWPKKRRNIVLLLCSIVLALIAVQAFNLVFPFLGASLATLAGDHGSTGSFFGRITVGPIAAFRILSQFPIFGVGIGNSDIAGPEIQKIWTESGAFIQFPWYEELSFNATNLMSNGFWWQWIYLGLLGTPIFILFTTNILRSIGVLYPFRAIFCAWIIWYSGGGFVDPISWFLVAIFSTSPHHPLSTNR